METWWETDERLSRSDLAAFLGIAVSTLSSGQSRGFYKFRRYKIAGQDWYRKSEVVEDIEKNHAA